MKAQLDINIYDFPFPSCGYTEIQKSNYRLLLMKSELEDFKKEELIKEYLNLDDFKIQRKNVGKDKEYGLIYQYFTNSFVPPDWYINLLIKSEYYIMSISLLI